MCRASEDARGAGDRARTGDLNLGKVALFQLSYTRESHRSDLNRRPLDYESSALPLSYGGTGGAGGIRTRDLLSAIQALSQTELRPLFSRERG